MLYSRLTHASEEEEIYTHTHIQIYTIHILYIHLLTHASEEEDIHTCTNIHLYMITEMRFTIHITQG